MDDFKKNSLVMIVLTTLASGINYLCQIIMGHVMSLESFGVMNSLFSVILVLSVPGTSVNMLTAKQIAERSEEEAAAASVSASMCRLCGLIGIILGVIVLLTCGITSTVMDTSILMILLTGAVVIVSLFPYIISGILAGKRAFLAAGLFSLIVPSFKMGGVGAAALLPGEAEKQVAVLGFMLLGNLVAIVLCRRVLWGNGATASRNTEPGGRRAVMDQVALLVMLANFAYLLFANADILLVKLCLGSEPAGMYSAVMMFGRIIFYFTTALVAVLLPYVSLEKSTGGSPSRVFRNSLLMTLAVSALCMIPVNVFPEFFIKLLYGEKYLAAAVYMPLSCGVSVLVSLVNLELNYFIGMGREKKAFVDLTAALAVLAALVWWHHGSVQTVLAEILCILAALFLYELRTCLGGRTASRGEKQHDAVKREDIG